MADIKLTNSNGDTISYVGVDSISVPLTTTGRATYVGVSGKLNITDTSEKDVTNYETAQVVDANLVAANIAEDVTILGVTGTHHGGITPTGSVTIIPSLSQQTIDVTEKATANVEAVETGTAGTPVATMGTVSNHEVVITPSVENITGYINGGTITGNSVTVSAGDLVDGNLAITPTTSAQNDIDVTNYETVSVAAIPVVTLDSSIISGEVYEETTGDYAWRSTVQVPAGYHNAQTLTKDFSDIFPAPETEGTADKMLIGYQLYDHSGKLVTGTMANNATATITLDETTTSYTVPAGYHTGSDTVSIQTETKSTDPTTSAQTITPTTGKVLTSVSISAIQTETKSVDPTTSVQTVTPTSGKYLTSVTVSIPSYNGEIV